jgi:hypothetical protein
MRNFRKIVLGIPAPKEKKKKKTWLLHFIFEKTKPKLIVLYSRLLINNQNSSQLDKDIFGILQHSRPR